MPLILLGNSIGHSLDIPARSLQWLKDADLVVFEEAKIARQSLKSAGIHRDFILHNEHKNRDSLAEIEEYLNLQKNVCYMSDQGMPGIADPGYQLVELAYSIDTKVQIISGPSSVTSVVAAYPDKVNEFHFAGFLPRTSKSRLQRLNELSKLRVPVVLMDTPYRLRALIKDVCTVYGKNHKALLAIEISNTSEEYHYKKLGDLQRICADKPRENFVLMV